MTIRSAIIAGKLFRRTLETAPVDRRSLFEMLGCVDDVLAALREYATNEEEPVNPPSLPPPSPPS